ncbi:MAG: hypothetical protein KAT09_00915 [Candidatus Aegiribacteria sp.]|nr:hypothetical protein [Candidatus Aegiribacteria sp.]
MNTLLAFIIYTMIFGVILLISMKLTGIHGSVAKVFAASAIANLVSLIPVALLGNILPFIVLIWLLRKWTICSTLPDIIFMVIVAWGLRVILGFLVISSLLNSV